MTETIFGKMYLPSTSTNLEEGVFMTYTAARHQGEMEMLWLHFWGEVKPGCHPSLYSFHHNEL